MLAHTPYWSQMFQMWLSPEHRLLFLCTLVPMFSCTVEPLGPVSLLEVWLSGCSTCMKTTSDRASPDWRWVRCWCHCRTSSDFRGEISWMHFVFPPFLSSLAERCIYDPQRSFFFSFFCVRHVSNTPDNSPDILDAGLKAKGVVALYIDDVLLFFSFASPKKMMKQWLFSHPPKCVQTFPFVYV